MIGTQKQIHQQTALLALVLALGVGLSGCGEKAPPATKRSPVLVTTVHNQAAGTERTFTGTVRAKHESEQGFRVGGKVVARLVDVGQTVTAGQPLARLDPADYALAVHAAEDQWQAARAEAEQASSDAARLQRLLADQSVSVADHERQKARADASTARQAQALRQLELARNRAKYTTLVAEFDGVITSVRFEAGQVVAEGQPVVTIAQPAELEVVADLPEDMVSHARALAASATFWYTSNRPVPLKLRELSPAAAAQTGTFRARFSIQDKSPATRQALHLGMTATVHLATKEGAPAAVLPATALIKTNGKTSVWQVNDTGHRLIEQPVEVVRYTDEAVLVRGLQDGAKVVSAGIQKVDAGQEITPIERSGSGMDLALPASPTALTNAAGAR